MKDAWVVAATITGFCFLPRAEKGTVRRLDRDPANGRCRLHKFGGARKTTALQAAAHSGSRRRVWLWMISMSRSKSRGTALSQKRHHRQRWLSWAFHRGTIISCTAALRPGKLHPGGRCPTSWVSRRRPKAQGRSDHTVGYDGNPLQEAVF